MSEANKHKVVKVELLWSENSLYQRVFRDLEPKSPPEYHGFREANRFLYKMAAAIEPDRLGYDKTAFRVTWDDGNTYEGRYDLHALDKQQENPSGFVDLADHILGHVSFLTGIRCPSHMSQQQYEECLGGMGQKEEAKAFLEEYEL